MLKVCQKARFPSPLLSTIGNNWKFIEKYLYKYICLSFYMHIHVCKTFTATCVPCVPLAALFTRAAILSKNVWILYTLIYLYLSQFFLHPQKKCWGDFLFNTLAFYLFMCIGQNIYWKYEKKSQTRDRYAGTSQTVNSKIYWHEYFKFRKHNFIILCMNQVRT